MNKKKEPALQTTLRIGDEEMAKRIQELAGIHGLSFNMTIQLLLGYAFNKIDEEGKEFKATVVFESE